MPMRSLGAGVISVSGSDDVWHANAESGRTPNAKTRAGLSHTKPGSGALSPKGVLVRFLPRLDYFLEGVACTEGWHLRGRYLHLLAGLRVTAFSGFALLNVELAKARYLHLLTILQCFLYYSR